MSLWMLYHLGYHDVPTTGVGIYGDSLETGEKVVILQKCGEYFPDHQQELTDLFSDIDKLHKLDDDHDGILLDTKDYSLELYFNTIAVHQKYKYDIFRISVNDMNGIEYKHKKFQEMVGYHTDHDPNIYRKFDASKDWRSFYHDTELSNIQIRDLNKEYINTFYYDDIKWINYK